jgi:SOS-response transcriptional repressor LexA
MTKENCDLWMTYIHREWLDSLARVEHESYLRTSTRNMIELMKLAVRARNVDEAWNRLERLKRLNEGFDSEARIDKYRYEKPESYMECALTAYELGDLQGSLELFRVSTGDFLPNSAYKAVCHWMVGCVQWQIPSRSESAVLSWERSLQVMSEFVSENLEDRFKQNVDEALKRKGKKAINDMRNAIDLASARGFPPPPPSQDSSSFNTNSDSKSRRTSSVPNTFSTRLKFLPCYGSIPAGDPTLVSQYHENTVGVDFLEIEERLCRIVGVDNQSEIDMLRGVHYFLMKASGDSMNNASPVNIKKCDYVLLKDTRDAVEGNVVAAVVLRSGEPETATLKRYHEDSGEKFLVSESSTVDPIHIHMSSKDYIQGVVVAILKPVDD